VEGRDLLRKSGVEYRGRQLTYRKGEGKGAQRNQNEISPEWGGKKKKGGGGAREDTATGRARRASAVTFKVTEKEGVSATVRDFVRIQRGKKRGGGCRKKDKAGLRGERRKGRAG